MTFGRIAKKDVFNAAKTWTPKGVARKDALKLAAQAGFRKRSSGSVADAKAARFFQKLEDKHELKSRVGADKISAYTSTAKRLVNEAKSKEADTGAAEIARKRLEEKKEILKDAGLKVDANKRASSKAEIHVEALNKANMDGAKTGDRPAVKVNMERALDKSGVEALNLGLPGTETAGYKPGVKAAVSQSERMTAAKMMGLKPGFAVPHPEAKPVVRPTVESSKKNSADQDEAPGGAGLHAQKTPSLNEADDSLENELSILAPTAPIAVPEKSSSDEVVDPYGEV